MGRGMREKRHIRAISYGGGRQTYALAILWGLGRIQADACIMADTGRELPHTYESNHVIDTWLRERGKPGLTVVQPVLGKKSGRLVTLTSALAEKQAVLPLYGSRGGMMPRRCTERFKIRIVRQELRRMGATSAEVLLGISTDEWHRAADSDRKWVQNCFPLLELGLSAADCEALPASVGLPPAERSACDICPHRPLAQWRELRERYPERYEYAVRTEASFRNLFLHPGRKPLPVLLDESGAADEVEDGCTSGYCFV
jgi:hypothetical protein